MTINPKVAEVRIPGELLLTLYTVLEPWKNSGVCITISKPLVSLALVLIFTFSRKESNLRGKILPTRMVARGLSLYLERELKAKINLINGG